MYSNPLSGYVSDVIRVVKKLKEKKAAAGKAAELRKSLAGMASGIRKKAYVEQGLNINMPMTAALVHGEQKTKGFDASSDPSFKAIADSNLPQDKKIKLLQEIYKQPYLKKPKRTIYDYRGLGKSKKEKDPFIRYKEWYNKYLKGAANFMSPMNIAPGRNQLTQLYDFIGKAKANILQLSPKYNKQKLLDELKRKKQELESFAFSITNTTDSEGKPVQYQRIQPTKEKIKTLQQKNLNRTKKEEDPLRIF